MYSRSTQISQSGNQSEAHVTKDLMEHFISEGKNYESQTQSLFNAILCYFSILELYGRELNVPLESYRIQAIDRISEILKNKRQVISKEELSVVLKRIPDAELYIDPSVRLDLVRQVAKLIKNKEGTEKCNTPNQVSSSDFYPETSSPSLPNSLLSLNASSQQATSPSSSYTSGYNYPIFATSNPTVTFHPYSTSPQPAVPSSSPPSSIGVHSPSERQKGSSSAETPTTSSPYLDSGIHQAEYNTDSQPTVLSSSPSPSIEVHSPSERQEGSSSAKTSKTSSPYLAPVKPPRFGHDIDKYLAYGKFCESEGKIFEAIKAYLRGLKIFVVNHNPQLIQCKIDSLSQLGLLFDPSRNNISKFTRQQLGEISKEIGELPQDTIANDTRMYVMNQLQYLLVNPKFKSLPKPAHSLSAPQYTSLFTPFLPPSSELLPKPAGPLFPPQYSSSSTPSLPPPSDPLFSDDFTLADSNFDWNHDSFTNPTTSLSDQSNSEIEKNDDQYTRKHSRDISLDEDQQNVKKKQKTSESQSEEMLSPKEDETDEWWEKSEPLTGPVEPQSGAKPVDLNDEVVDQKNALKVAYTLFQDLFPKKQSNHSADHASLCTPENSTPLQTSGERISKETSDAALTEQFENLKV